MIPPDEETLRPRLDHADPRDLTLLEVNARFMRKEQYDRLVANIRRDGCLTSVPLVWNDPGSDRRIVLSGNHRVQAAVDAGLVDIPVMVVDQDLPRERQIALQLSHNAIAGEDDPATLKQLYDELDDVDWRSYSGLDDKQLGLLAAVSLEGLSEANLDFVTVQLVFLPAELEAAKTALEEARKLVQADERWLAAYRDYEPTLDALSTVHGAHNVGNVATALALILAVFERHLDELRDGVWYDPDTGKAINPRQLVPLEAIFGCRSLPADIASACSRCLRDSRRDRDG